jgi:hypothetical protein
MRPVATMLFLLTPLAHAQDVVSLSELPGVLRDFESHPGDQPLRCDVTPLPPAIDFAFRFTAGYTLHVPRFQYSASATGWSVLTAITPESGEPTYLLSHRRLAEAPAAGSDFEIRGRYFLGVGRYTVEATLRDDRSRVCRKQWRVTVAPSRADRAIPLALPPSAVRGYSPIPLPDTGRPDDAAPMRLTILLNAAAFSTHRTVIRETDRERIAGGLTALLEHLPTTSLRLVVFSLEQQQEILRTDAFRPDDVIKVADSIDAAPQATVDVKVLKNPHGHVDFLAGLIDGELNRPDPADTVVFLGSTSRYADKAPPGAMATVDGSPPRFFYVRYEGLLRPTLGDRSTLGSRRLQAEQHGPPRLPSDPSHGQPDIITKAVARLNGKTMIVHTPAELAGAIRKIEIRRDN